jgi:hypothetical protein
MRTTFALPAFAVTALLFSAGCGSGDDSSTPVPQEAGAEGGDAAKGGDGASAEATAPASEAGAETGSEASSTPNDGGSDVTVSDGGGESGAD